MRILQSSKVQVWWTLACEFVWHEDVWPIGDWYVTAWPLSQFKTTQTLNPQDCSIAVKWSGFYSYNHFRLHCIVNQVCWSRVGTKVCQTVGHPWSSVTSTLLDFGTWRQVWTSLKLFESLFASCQISRGYWVVCKSTNYTRNWSKVFSSVQKKDGDESTCSTVDRPPEVEDVVEEEEEDSTIPEDCYTESETRTLITVCSIDYILLIVFVCLRSQTASGDVLAWSLTFPKVKGRHGGIYVKPATSLWSTAILKPSSSSWSSSAVERWWALICHFSLHWMLKTLFTVQSQ